jgi:hypothetical protein
MTLFIFIGVSSFRQSGYSTSVQILGADARIHPIARLAVAACMAGLFHCRPAL